MTTELGKVATYHEELPLIRLPHPLTTYFCEVMLHIKYIFSPPTLDQSLLKMARW